MYRLIEGGVTRISYFLSLLFLSLLLFLPPLIPFHAPPLNSFWNEWAAGVIVLLLIFFVWINAINRMLLSKALLLWVCWGGAIALSAYENHYTSFFPVFSAGIFWFLGALTLISIGELKEHIGLEPVCLWISVALVLSGVAQSVLGLAKYYGFLAYFAPYLLPFRDSRLGGTLSYPTIAGFSLWLSLIALVYLYARSKISNITMTGIALLFGLTIVATQNRSSILYCGAMIVVSLIVWIRAKRLEKSSSGNGSLAVMVRGALIAMVTLIIAVPMFGVVDRALSKQLNQLGYIHRSSIVDKRNWESVGIRSSEFRKAIYLAKRSPVFGVGVGNYPYQSFRLDSVLPNSLREGTVNTHTHNLFSMILAEEGGVGLAVVVLSLVILGYWWWSIPSSVEAFYLGSTLSIFFIFSNLEFPLWYLNFLTIFIVFCGLVAPIRVAKIDHRWLRPLMAAGILVVGGLVGANIAKGYAFISRVFIYRVADEHTQQTLASLIPDTFLGPYAGYAVEMITDPEIRNAKGQLRLANMVVHVWPMPNALLSKVILQEFLGKHDEACRLAEKAANSYPIIMLQYDKLMTEYAARPELAAGDPKSLQSCFKRGKESWLAQWGSEKASSTQVARKVR